MTGPVQRPHRPDYWIMVITGALVVLGLQAVYSASFAIGLAEFDDPNYFFTRQLIWAVAGLAAMLVAMRISYRRWRRWSPYLMGLALVMLLLLMVPGLGITTYGATRWLSLGPLPFNLQPSEFTKFAFLCYLAAWLASRPERVRSISGGFIPFGLMAGLVLGLIMKEPDLGTAIVISMSAVTVFFIAGADLRYFLPALGGGFTLGTVLISMEGYRLSRWAAFVNPWEDPAGKGFHIIQMLIALGSGGFEGRGIGVSRQKFFYVPSSHNDGIFSIIGEELGFIGALLVFALFAALLYRGFLVVARSRDQFAGLFAAGIVCWVAFQALMNIGGVTRSVPLAGIPLPFISYGGTSLLMLMAAMGILLNISRYTDLPTESRVQMPMIDDEPFSEQELAPLPRSGGGTAGNAGVPSAVTRTPAQTERSGHRPTPSSLSPQPPSEGRV